MLTSVQRRHLLREQAQWAQYRTGPDGVTLRQHMTTQISEAINSLRHHQGWKRQSCSRLFHVKPLLKNKFKYKAAFTTESRLKKKRTNEEMQNKFLIKEH